MFLTKYHTEKRRGRRIIKTKQWKSRRHRQCMELRSLFAHFFSNFMTKAFIPKVIKNLYATPLSLFVLSAPPLHCITSVPSVTLCAYYIRRLVQHSIFRKNQTTIYFVIKNSTHENQHMLFQVRKDALLACKRCPLRPLLTPF